MFLSRNNFNLILLRNVLPVEFTFFFQVKKRTGGTHVLYNKKSNPKIDYTCKSVEFTNAHSQI